MKISEIIMVIITGAGEDSNIISRITTTFSKIDGKILIIIFSKILIDKIRIIIEIGISLPLNSIMDDKIMVTSVTMETIIGEIGEAEVEMIGEAEAEGDTELIVYKQTAMMIIMLTILLLLLWKANLEQEIVTLFFHY